MIKTITKSGGSFNNEPILSFDKVPILTDDFGDAPAPYPTLLINSGASHTIGVLNLGINIDAEPDGQPHATALGDDLVGLPDEDGVIFTTPITKCIQANVTVIASAPGKLDAWLDFNDDGDWVDPNERIFTSTLLSAGPNFLTFPVPCTATATPTTFARFRLSSAGGLSFTGHAADGEVEDYAVPIFDHLPPFVDPGGPYTGTEGIPLPLDGSGSFDDSLIVLFE